MSRRVAVKICGLTRAEDTAVAVNAGARHVGVIMAGGPRQLDVSRAREVFAPSAPGQRVVVFGGQDRDEVVRIADSLDLAVLQLHGGATPDDLDWLRERTSAERWAVIRVDGAEWPFDEIERVAPFADGLVLDAKVPGQLGGTGVPLPWAQLSSPLATWRQRHPTVRLVLAGGLRANRIAEALRWLSPDVLDVSSGVERAPGIKDPIQVRAFLSAAEHGDD
jgi:phosphoribosylanthranilate isomerase